MAAGPADVKLDLPGSSDTIGIQNSRNDRIIRTGIVDNIAATNRAAMRKEAVEAVLKGANFITFAQFPDIPLQTIRAVNWGKKVLVTLTYFRSRFSVPQSPSINVAQFRTAYDPVVVYRAFTAPSAPDIYLLDPDNTGMPNGEMISSSGNQGSPQGQTLLTDPKRRPEHWVWRRPAIKIIINAQLTFNPYGIVKSKEGTINNDSITLGPDVFPPKTVRFDGLSVDWNVERFFGGSQPFGNIATLQVKPRFNVQYIFTALRPGGGNGTIPPFTIQFYKQHAYWNGNPPQGFWDTWNEQEYPDTDFAGAFPVNL